MFLTEARWLSRPLYEAYWLGLSDLTLSAVEQAVAMAIRTSQQFPRPIDLRRLAGEQTHEQRAIDAWGDVLRAVPRGGWKHIDFADKLINAVIRNLGGWPSFLDRFDGSEGEKWARIEFLKTYSLMGASGVNGEAIAPLSGLSEQTSVGGKLQAPIPFLIECTPDRARLPTPMRQAAIEATRAVPMLTLKKVVD